VVGVTAWCRGDDVRVTGAMRRGGGIGRRSRSGISSRMANAGQFFRQRDLGFDPRKSCFVANRLDDIGLFVLY
jgi:hypothetical protein